MPHALPPKSTTTPWSKARLLGTKCGAPLVRGYWIESHFDPCQAAQTLYLGQSGYTLDVAGAKPTWHPCPSGERY